MKRHSTIIIIVSLLLAYIAVLTWCKKHYPSNYRINDNQKKYVEKIQFIENKDKAFLWERDEGKVLSPKEVYLKFKNGGFQPFPNKVKFSENSSDFDSLWIYIQTPDIKINITDKTSPLICLRPSKFQYISFSKVTLYSIEDGKPMQYASTGRTVNRKDKLSEYHQNDWCFSVPNSIINGYSNELLANISTKGTFRDSLYAYYSTNEIEVNNHLQRREEERPKYVFILIFIGILGNFLLYAALQYAMLRYRHIEETAYLWYGFYLFCTILYSLGQLDYCFAIDSFVSYIIKYHYGYEVPILMLQYIAYVKFIDVFLKFKDDEPSTHKALKFIVSLMIAIVVIDFVVRNQWGVSISMKVFYGCRIALILATIYISYVVLTLKNKSYDKKKVTLYSYIFTGSVILILSGLITITLRGTDLVNNLGIFSHRQNINRLGILIENLFFMSALAYKARLDLEERSFLKGKIENAELRAKSSKIPIHTTTNILQDIDELLRNKQFKVAKKYAKLFQVFLRNHYEQSFKKKIKLAEELASAETYIKLRSINPNRRINFIKKYNDIDCGYYRIPPGILIPIIENAINYAFPINDSSNAVTISLVENEAEQLAISIEDNGKGMDTKVIKSKTSTGVNSIEEICAQHNIQLEIKQNTPNGTIVIFYL